MKLGRTIPLSVLAATAAAGAPSAAAAFPSPPAVCQGSEGYAAAFGGRRTFTLRPGELEAIKASLQSDPAVAQAYRMLIAQADQALARKPGSVLDKRTIPLSGDRHDYVSLAPYWWPDPVNPKGPYVRRDGQVNPERETNRFDRTALGRLINDTDTLGLAYYYSGDRNYADKAAALVRAWFLDPATAMNPNMNYAQAVPGRENGRAEGVLDTSGFIAVIDAVGLIGPSGALSAEEVKALEGWFSRYVDWMRTSANGKAEAAARNNHGIWYDAQLARFALFARRDDIARRTVAAFAKARIEKQVDPSGALPHELTRTRSFHYSVFTLDAAYHVADSAACMGIDLYGADMQGRSLRKATAYVAAYRGRQADWPYKEMKWPAEALDELLTRADAAWGPGAYPRAASGDMVLRYRTTR
ncbi:alginate lyase family protein [Sphingomonas sp. BT-65]|uniref:alginate lyase family protein n=1 Tax=Sphingomonas sp. BT-65 TaxID=2989821 RepID=UPI0022367508|nr:alginate lyase family protein [Sphingomonas sp. BT-65]MCW4463402.1 alginate lyase family protein [Sphingomonas sp. BT-65]